MAFFSPSVDRWLLIYFQFSLRERTICAGVVFGISIGGLLSDAGTSPDNKPVPTSGEEGRDDRMDKQSDSSYFAWYALLINIAPSIQFFTGFFTIQVLRFDQELLSPL